MEIEGENLFEGSEEERLERQEALAMEKDRIENLLVRNKWLNIEEAEQLVGELSANAEELDYLARKIFSDPIVKSKYDYDGEFFTPKDKKEMGFCHSADGLCLLKKLNEDRFLPFVQNGILNIKALKAWIENIFLWVPRVRLRNLEENGTISMVDKETIKEVARLQSEREKREAQRRGPIPHSVAPEFRDFLSYYEEEMNSWQEKKDE